MIYDKRTATNVIGCLMKKPDFLVDTDKFMLDKDDFQIPLHRIVFSAIYNLFHQGAEKITVNDLHVYLQKYPELYSLFNQNKGSDFILAAEETGEVENFVFYYDRVKKLSLLRNLQEANFYIGDWYAEGSYDINQRQALEKKLEDALPQEIITSIQGKLFDIESNFVNKKTFHYGEANVGIEDLISSLKEVPEIGLPLQGEMFTTVCRGARKGKMYLMSGGTGMGKSRLAVGNACHLAYPIRWDRNKGKWVNSGSNQKILFITTELAFDEIQTMIIANISAVNEEKILNGKYDTIEEKNRVMRAVEIIKSCHNVYIEFVPEPSIDSIAAKIRLYALQKDIEYVFYDYVHVSGATYQGKKDMRDDVWLMLFVDKLKQLANELDIHISTATQLNASSYEDREIKNEAMIRGAKSIADKVDFAMITTTIVKAQEKEIARALATQLGTPEPTQILDVYKNRRGKWRNIRIWRYTDLGTCRSQDCFVTDTSNNPIDMKSIKLKVNQLVSEGAFPVVDEKTGEIIEENRKVSEISDY